MSLTRETFDEWLSNPVTEEVVRALLTTAEFWKAMWMDKAWELPYLTTEKQIEISLFKAKARVFREVAAMTFDDFEAWSSKEQ
jgi:hypothetical protein